MLPNFIDKLPIQIIDEYFKIKYPTIFILGNLYINFGNIFGKYNDMINKKSTIDILCKLLAPVPTE